MNTVQKGYRNECKTRKFLQDAGFVVQNTIRSAYKGGQNDFFGLWDHIAVKLETGEVWFIQTKSNKKPAKAYIEKLRAFPALNKYLFIWKDYVKCPEIIQL